MESPKWPSLRGLFFCLLLAASLLTLAGCRAQTSGLTVFCAASLSATVEEVARLEALPLSLNSGGSNALVRQVGLGAEADLLLLADDTLAKQQLEPQGYRVVALASNELVVVVPEASPLQKDENVEKLLHQVERYAVAEAKTAPLGGYTEEALTGWTTPAKPVPLQDAGAVLSAVALGHVPLGIVYRSDAQAETKVRIVATIPQERHRPVRYVAALPPGASAQAQQLVESLVSGRGRTEMQKAGFLPPSGEAKAEEKP